MPAEICRRCNAVEECYEFMLAYAAQGLASGDGSQSGGRDPRGSATGRGCALGTGRRLRDRGESRCT